MPPNRNLYVLGGAVGVGVVGFLYFRKKATTGAPPTTVGAKQPSFSQQQEVQDFQIFSALTGAQQASDLNFLGTVAGLFAGGSSTGVGSGGSVSGGGGGGGTVAPAPPSTGTAPPATTPASNPGYGLVQTSNGQMVWLGVTGPGGSTAGDYQVGGGAPVYFGNAQGSAIGGTTQQGVDVYTPAAYSGLVSGSPG